MYLWCVLPFVIGLANTRHLYNELLIGQWRQLKVMHNFAHHSLNYAWREQKTCLFCYLILTLREFVEIFDGSRRLKRIWKILLFNTSLSWQYNFRNMVANCVLFRGTGLVQVRRGTDWPALHYNLFVHVLLCKNFTACVNMFSKIC